MGEMMTFWAHLTGKRAPLIHVPAALLRPFAPLMGVLHRGFDLPSAFSQEATASLGVTYMARADKARAELGWQTRPLQEGMLETFASIAETESQRALDQQPQRERQVAGLALVTAVVLFLYWLIGRRRQDK
jgi:hypothetical protein